MTLNTCLNMQKLNLVLKPCFLQGDKWSINLPYFSISLSQHVWPGVRNSSNWKICWETHQKLSVIFLCQALTVWFWHPAGELPGKFIMAGLRLAKYLRSMFSIWRVGDVDKTRGNPTPMKWSGSGISTEREQPLRFNRAYISHTGLQELIAWD